MILIISENSDESTIDVINWLMFYDLSFTRINSDDILELFSTKSGFYLLNKEKKITIKNVSSCWFRRGFLNVRSNNLINNKYFQEEEYWYKDYIYYLLEQKKSISSYRKTHYNKLIVNKIASNFGIKIPNFIISNFKKDIPNEKKHITKTINGLGVVDFSENFKGYLYTKFINKNTIPNKFHLSLIQEYVEKKYELRIFYLHERFWSMAIFSQKDEQTKVDFRNYNKEKPNRTILLLKIHH